MIVLSVGLQKSGSALLFNITNDLLIHNGFDNARDIRDKYDLHSFMLYYNCNIGVLNSEKLAILKGITDKKHTFAVKTHSSITDTAKELIEAGIVKATCIYRDPRDVVLSAMNHGERIRNDNLTHSFANCTDLETTVNLVKNWLDNSILNWLELNKEMLLQIKYENLITNPLIVLQKLASFLCLDVENHYLMNIYNRYKPQQLDCNLKDYLHFNKGIVGRYKETLSPLEIEYCNSVFEKHLSILGYEK